MYKVPAVALLLSSANASLTKTVFSKQLNGEKQMTHDDFEMMFNFFESEFESPNKGVKSLEHRKINFAESIERIIEHNKKNTAYKKGINAYSDMNDEEFAAHFNIKKVGEDQHCSATMTNRQGVEALQEVPSEWNWRNHDGVSPVKNQGHCGSCWTFSTVGALEAHTMIKYDGNTDFYAEQQLVDCAQDFDNHGCEGGLPSHAFEYIKYAGGISTETAYPYKATDEACTVKSDTFALSVPQGSFNITQGDEVSTKNALFSNGPVSVAFEVVDGFRDYSTGVYTSTTCKNSPDDVNHAVLAVGYGSENGMDYWLVKNSWGADWGDEGFFKIQRGVNMCGIAVCNSYPVEVTKLSQEQQFLQ